MKNLKNQSTILKTAIFVLLAFFAVSCEQESVAPKDVEAVSLTAKEHHLSKSNTFYGPAVPVGGGVIKTLIEINHAGEPLAVGISMSEKALTKLPNDPSMNNLQFHKKANGLIPFKHLSFDWNPEGHEPPEVYDLKHFDLHFYMISVEERMDMIKSDEAENLPSAEYMPEDYFPTPGYVPMMGKHWLDKFAPELQFQKGDDREKFTHTFIYGSYNEKVIFYEPMITLDYLLKKQNEQFDIKQPKAFEQEGLYYPTKYSMQYDAVKKEYLILLEGLVQR